MTREKKNKTLKEMLGAEAYLEDKFERRLVYVLLTH
jgi:hypothetical protein